MRESSGISNLNLAVVGAKGCGKSALTVRFLTRRFIGEYDSHADVCIERRLQIAGRLVDIHLKDTAGCDWLKGPSALIGWSTALVLVYSVCDARSFDLARFILQKLNVHKRLENGCVMLIGNKNDLEHLREISEEEGRELAHNYGIHFHETSAAVNYDSVDSAFKRLLLDTLSIQITKLSLLHNSSESLDTLTRKNSTVVRDHPTRRSVRRVSLRKSSGSFDSTRDSLSSFSDEENCHVIVTSPSPIDSPVLSPDSSPAVTTKRRKISIPTIFDKLKHTSTKNLPAKMR